LFLDHIQRQIALDIHRQRVNNLHFLTDAAYISPDHGLSGRLPDLRQPFPGSVNLHPRRYTAELASGPTGSPLLLDGSIIFGSSSWPLYNALMMALIWPWEIGSGEIIRSLLPKGMTPEASVEKQAPGGGVQVFHSFSSIRGARTGVVSLNNPPSIAIRPPSIRLRRWPEADFTAHCGRH
jgi:hypothetical protein